MSVKFPFFGGGFGGGGSADFIFMGARIFLIFGSGEFVFVSLGFWPLSQTCQWQICLNIRAIANGNRGCNHETVNRITVLQVSGKIKNCNCNWIQRLRL